MFHLLHWGLPEGVHFPVGNPLGTWNIFSRASSTCKGTYTYTFNWCSTSTNYDSNKAEQGNCQKHLTLIYQRKSASINTRLNTGYGSMNINNYSLKFWGMVIHKSQYFNLFHVNYMGFFRFLTYPYAVNPGCQAEEPDAGDPSRAARGLATKRGQSAAKCADEGARAGHGWAVGSQT